MKKKTRAAWVGVAASAAATVLVLTWFAPRQPEDETATAENPPGVDSATSSGSGVPIIRDAEGNVEAVAAATPDNAPGADRPGSEDADPTPHSVPDDAKVRARLAELYKAPKVDAKGMFELLPQRVAWDATCEGRSDVRRFDALSDVARAQGFAVRARVPNEGHILDWNQYYKFGDRFVSVSIVWNKDAPATYDVRAYVGKTMELEERLADAPLPKEDRLSRVDALRAVGVLDAWLGGKGATRGARTMVMANEEFPPDDFDAVQLTQVEVFNGRVEGYRKGVLMCSGGDESLCRCEFK